MVVCIVRPHAGIGQLLLIDMLRCADGTNQGLLRGVECGIHAECLEVRIQRCEVLGLMAATSARSKLSNCCATKSSIRNCCIIVE